MREKIKVLYQRDVGEILPEEKFELMVTFLQMVLLKEDNQIFDFECSFTRSCNR